MQQLTYCTIIIIVYSVVRLEFIHFDTPSFLPGIQ